jgi:serine/threonine protein kinase/Tfp pilus assembly protein PilF
MIGKTIAHYRIIEQLGVGGMGVVYKAEDNKLKRTVALKFLPPELTRDPEAKARFIREAQAASALEHSNICNIHEIDETAEGQIFIVMACYEGETLKDKIKDKRLKTKEAIDIAIQIAQGMEKAHEKGIIHRDIKPANIFITADGNVKILDFGLAKLTGQAQLTKDASTLGTVAYMSPEQLSGEEVDQRADIWSLGVVLYEMITGQPPFKGDYEQVVIYAILNEEPKSLESAPSELQDVVLKALCKNPDERYIGFAELLNDLTSIQENYRLKKHGQPSLKSTRKKAIIISAVAAFILITAIAGVLFFPTSESESSIKSLAVLPFLNNKPDPNTDYLGLAFAAEIISDMSYFKNIAILPFSSIRDMSSKKELNVDYVLAGNFIKLEDRISLNIECFERETDRIIWQESLNRPFKESHVLLSDVSEKVINGLKIQFSNNERERMEKDIPQNPIAYEYYLRGISYPLSNEGHSLAIEMLKKSVEWDSTFSPAYTELGYRIERLAQNDLTKFKDIEKAEKYYNKALELNSENLIALNELSTLNQGTGKIYEAMDMAIKALQLNPSSAQAHFSMSSILRCTGQLIKSREEAQIALKLDPNNHRFRSYGHVLVYLGEYKQAIGAYDIDKNSPWAKTFKGMAFFRQKMYPEAIKYFNEVIKIESESRVKLYCLSMLAFLSGDYVNGLKYVNKIADAGPQDSELIYQIASLFGLFSDHQNCILYLRKAIERDYLNYPFMLRDEFLNPVRVDPEFQKVLALAKEKHETFKSKYFPK